MYNIENEVLFLTPESLERCEIVTDKKLNISYNDFSLIDLSILVSLVNTTYHIVIEEAIHFSWP